MTDTYRRDGDMLARRAAWDRFWRWFLTEDKGLYCARRDLVRLFEARVRSLA